MAKVYVCDACGETIDNPHKVKMKEFYIGLEFDIGGGVSPLFTTRKTRVHLCGDCYHALCFIGEKQHPVVRRKERQ